MRGFIILISLLFLYTLGGSASLTYQVVLQRKLTQLIGIDIYSVTFIVFLYMLGIGLGALAGKKIGKAQYGDQILQIAILQVALGVSAYISFQLLAAFGSFAILAGLPPFLYYFVLSVPILVPTTIMGVLTPLMVSTISESSRYGISVGLSYGMNVAGAALGALGSGLFLIGTYGLHLTLVAMAIVDVSVGIAIYALTRMCGLSSSSLRQAIKGIAGYMRIGIDDVGLGSSSIEEFPGGDTRKMGMAFFAIGFAALGYEIFSFRLLGTVFGTSPYLFPILLFCYLMQLSIGTILGGVISRFVSVQISYPIILVLFLVSTYFTVHLQNFLPEDTYFLTLSSLYTNYQYQLITIAAALALTMVALTPVLFLSSLMPIFLEHAQKAMPNVNFGFAYFWQTAGNIAGVIVTGLVLFEFLSLPQVNVVMIVLAIAGSITAFLSVTMASRRTVGLLSGIIVVVSFCVLYSGYPRDFYDKITYQVGSGIFAKPVKVYEDGQSLSLLYPKWEGATSEYALMSNGKFYVTGILSEVKDDQPNYLPSSFAGLAFSLNPSIKDALFIGGAHFAEQMYAESNGAKITIVDINDHVFQATLDFGIPEAKAQITHSEVHVIDGRRFVNSTNRKYDYIHVGIDKATTAGAGNVFSRDFFEVIKEKLSDNGVVTFYAYPTVVKAAMGVFADVVVVGYDEGNAIAAASVNRLTEAELSSAQTFATDTAREERYGNRFVFKNTHSRFLYNKSALATILAGVGESSDDNLATEYILSRDVEIFPSVHGVYGPRDIRVWPSNATQLTALRQRSAENGFGVVSSGSDVGGAPLQLPFEVVRSGGLEENSAAVIADDGSIELQLTAAEQFEWPELSKPAGAQWEVARGYEKSGQNPINLLLRGRMYGRGLVGLKVFCGDELVGSNFSYAETVELPVTALENRVCKNVNLHVTMDSMPGKGKDIRFNLKSILLSEE